MTVKQHAFLETLEMLRKKTLINLGLASLTVAVVMWGALAPSAQAHPDFGCKSCHVPHGAYSEDAVPLWNPEHSEITRDLGANYSSKTMDASVAGIPDGASKLCLSCHDGSYDHVSDAHSFDTAAEPGGGLGTLAQSHPISFIYDDALAAQDGELVMPSTFDDEGGIGNDVLDGNGKMQCTSCHDIHATEGRQEEHNLRWSYDVNFQDTAAFCRNCHVK